MTSSGPVVGRISRYHQCPNWSLVTDNWSLPGHCLPVAGLLALLDLSLDEVPLERGQVVDEEDAVEVIVLVHDAPRGQVHGIHLEPLAVDILSADDDALRPLDFEEDAGKAEAPFVALLFALGHQNFWIDGRAYWSGIQLDEVAFPVILAWRLWKLDALGNFDPYSMVRRACAFLIREGPVTAQDRWEEASGYSPSTLAAHIAALICGAEFLEDRGDKSSAEFVRDYADFLETHIPGTAERVGAKRWLYESGMPANAPVFRSADLDELTALARE